MHKYLYGKPFFHRYVQHNIRVWRATEIHNVDKLVQLLMKYLHCYYCFHYECKQ